MTMLTEARWATPLWMDHALCADADPDLFFPPDDEDAPVSAYAQTLAAKKVCAACPVRAECLDYSITENIQWGVWGGIPERPRRAMRAKVHSRQVRLPGFCGKGVHIRTPANTGTNNRGGDYCKDCQYDYYIAHHQPKAVA